MKRFFRWLFILAIICIITFIILGLILPKDFKVNRSIIINARYETVFSQIKDLKSMTKWSPWTDFDPNMKIEFLGIDGKTGSKFKWTGNELVGKGTQEIISISENKVKTRIDFIEPRETQAFSTLELKQTHDGIQVSWDYEGHTPFPWNAFSIFMSMDENLGKDFERGLNKLDSICIRHPML